ncbi:hypothetical protein [Leptodesmis sichuanensis]|uniref:hypothetical protein n=1 Tax=Leptodesmis sichuanensis TaxID=2906798 RepID=UPI001F313806|nr:hypothetical protein [Leptodesmis sichuanensis]UIE40243.1 hypothetical protein KIK02_12315 [Leptodesmis sichuanensis A121]
MPYTRIKHSSAESIASKAVISTATWIDKLVSTALVVAIVVVATKITAAAKFKIPGIDVEFDTGYTWGVPSGKNG